MENYGYYHHNFTAFEKNIYVAVDNRHGCHRIVNRITMKTRNTPIGAVLREPSTAISLVILF